MSHPTENVCMLCKLPITCTGHSEVLRSQEYCCDYVRAMIYALPAVKRRVLKPMWAHLYAAAPQ